MAVFRLFFSAGQIHITYPIRIHCFYMFISASCSNLKPPELSLAPESRHRHGTRQFAMFIAETNGKLMVKSRLLPFFQQKPALFWWKRWKSHQNDHMYHFFHHGINLQNPMMKTFQKSRCSQVDVPFRTDLTAVNLPDCLDIEPFWTQSLCVNPGTKTQKYRWWWFLFQCQRFPNIVGLYLFTSPAKSICIPKSSDGDPKTRQSVGWGVWTCLKCEPITTWSSGGSTNLGIFHIQLSFLTSKSSQVLDDSLFFPTP